MGEVEKVLTRDEKIVASFAVMLTLRENPDKLKNPKWIQAMDAALWFIESMPEQEVKELFENDDEWISRMELKHGASAQQNNASAKEHSNDLPRPTDLCQPPRQYSLSDTQNCNRNESPR